MRAKRRLYAGSGLVAKKLAESEPGIEAKDVKLRVDGEDVDTEQAVADFEGLEEAIYQLATLETPLLEPEREDFDSDEAFERAMTRYEGRLERKKLAETAPKRDDYESDADFERAQLIHKRLSTRKKWIGELLAAVPNGVKAIRATAENPPALSPTEQRRLASGEHLPVIPDADALLPTMKYGAALLVTDSVKETGKRLHQAKDLVVGGAKWLFSLRKHPVVATPTAFVAQNAKRLLDKPAMRPVKVAGGYAVDAAPYPVDVLREALFRAHPHKVAATHLVEATLPDGTQKFARVSVSDPGIELSILKEVIGTKVASIPPFIPFSGIPLCGALAVRFHKLATAAYRAGNLPEAKAFERARDDLVVYSLVGATWVVGEGLYSAAAALHGARAQSVKDEDFVEIEWLRSMPEIALPEKQRKPPPALRALLASFRAASGAAASKYRRRRLDRVIGLESLALAAKDPAAAVSLLRSSVMRGLEQSQHAQTMMRLSEASAAKGNTALSELYRRTAVKAIEASLCSEGVAEALEKAIEKVESGEGPDATTIAAAQKAATKQLAAEAPIEAALAKATVEATEAAAEEK
ncbi:MAG: hypothetical protein RIT81_33450 [Deltaproteobacteria bacterium]